MAKLAINGGPKSVTIKQGRDPIYEEMVKEEEKAIVELLHKDEISLSPIVEKLEEEWSSYVGTKYCLAQNNGTSTLHAACFAVGVEPGDEVITSVFSWHLQITTILACHGIPVFCDTDPLTLCIDTARIEEKITSRTKAIVVTHVYGHPVDMDPVMEIAHKHNLAVIEDASHAHGVEYKGRKVGSIGDIGCFSLQGSKLMTGGEAGLFVTNNTEYYERAIILGHYERMKGLTLKKYEQYKSSKAIPPMNWGFKYRIHPFAAAMARVQLKYLERRNELERKNCEYIDKGIADIKGIDPPHITSYARKVTWLMYLARFYPDEFKGVSRERIIEALQAEGIAATTGRTGYIPLHLQPLVQEQGKYGNLYGKGCPWKCSHALPQKAYREGDFPIAEKVYKERINLPNFRDIAYSTQHLDQYIEGIRKVLERIGESR